MAIVKISDLDAEECDRCIKLRKGVDSRDINEWDLDNEQVWYGYGLVIDDRT